MDRVNSMIEALLRLLDAMFPGFPNGLQGWTLLLLRTGVGGLFILHGYPKLTHLRQWADSLKISITLCFLSALSMFLGGLCLIAGVLTPLASAAILGSMVVAMGLELSQGLPLVGLDPYLIPDGQYLGPDGLGDPPSYEKALMFILMLITLMVFGPGAFSLDALLFS